MTQPVTLYSAGMVANPANSDDRRTQIPPRSADRHPDAASRDETGPHITAIILTGGGSTRFGEDKASAQVAGSTMLGHVLADIHAWIPVVIVGPTPPRARAQAQAQRPGANSRSQNVTREQVHEPGLPDRSLIVTCEDPPGGGPVAGILAGLELVATPICCVIATDMPTSASIALSLASDHVRQLGPSSAPEALVPIDSDGHAQPLCASYSTAALRSASTTLGSGHSASMRDLLSLLRVSRVQLTQSDRPKLFDIDTRDDLARSRQAIMAHVGGSTSRPNTGGTNMLNDWATAAASELELDTEVDVDLILDVAKEAAHGVARPAAPLTTYLLGYAVAKGADLQELAAKLNTLAQGWPENQD